MFDYRNHLKSILNQTAGDEQSLCNGLAAIKAILGMEAEYEPLAATPKQVTLDIQTVNSLLIGLTALISQPGNLKAKKQALKAVHQLQMNADVPAAYRQNLANLEQAIKKSQIASETINRQVFQQALQPSKQPKRDYRKGKRYIVIRLLAGCDLINDSNRRVFTLKESQIHNLNLKTGDIVEAVALLDHPSYEAEILRVVGFRQLPRLEVDQIATFKYAVVQGRPGHLAISRNIKGEKLRIQGKALLLPIDASAFQEHNFTLMDGAIVDLAWYEGDVNLKKNPAQAIKIRWVYDLDSPQASQPVKKKKSKSASEAVPLDKLDLDLHYQRVGIAVGDNQNEALLERIVTRYHGIPFAIDAFQGKKKLVEQQIKELDIVILVTAFAAHDSTWKISEFASKYHVKFAVSSSKGFQAFERALYRAAKGMPAYEGTQPITYQYQTD